MRKALLTILLLALILPIVAAQTGNDVSIADAKNDTEYGAAWNDDLEIITPGENISIKLISSGIARNAFFYKGDIEIADVELCTLLTCNPGSVKYYTIPQGWKGDYDLVYNKEGYLRQGFTVAECNYDRECLKDATCVHNLCEECSGKSCAELSVELGKECGMFYDTCSKEQVDCLNICDVGKECNETGQCVEKKGVPSVECLNDTDCEATEKCVNTMCVQKECPLGCIGKECGDNGCGGSCGNCSAGKSCVNGKCIEAAPKEEYVKYTSNNLKKITCANVLIY